MSNLSALVGAVVSCWFPQHDAPSKPGPKFRPVLVAGYDPRAKRVLVAYGTSQRTHQNHRGEITFTPSEIHGLSKDTKFCLSNAQWLPLSADYFADSRGKQKILGKLPRSRASDLQNAIEEII